MRAMILAAGRGERMRPLTNNCPKALLEVNGKPLIQYHIENLARQGISEIIINHGIMGDQIEERLGTGKQFGADIIYSAEGNTPLETGGGIYQALPLLGDMPFIVVNADVWTDFAFGQLPDDPPGLAHLVLVDNPEHHPAGDFVLSGKHIKNTGPQKLTFSGIGVYRHELFKGCKAGVFPLVSILRKAIDDEQVTGEYFQGVWADVGTPERLKSLQSP